MFSTLSIADAAAIARFANKLAMGPAHLSLNLQNGCFLAELSGLEEKRLKAVVEGDAILLLNNVEARQLLANIGMLVRIVFGSTPHG